MTGKSIRGILEYNENKVRQGTAKLIMASGFALDIDRLNFNQKLMRFTKLNQLNPTVRTNAMHISLNFDPSDQIDTEKMQLVVQAYMERIGFGDQPYLVYRHGDAGHPHLHIATNLIRPDGKRQHTHDIGRLVSEPARKWVEQEFGLVKAEGRKLSPTNYIRPIIYGERPTKQALSSILLSVTADYLFCSVAELNAILGTFNVRAETGSEDSVMFQKKGLLYTVLDPEGRAIGVPMKASSFQCRPTLANLEKKFEKNVALKKKFRETLKIRIDRAMGNKVPDTFLLKQELAKQGIDLVIRRNGEGRVYGMTYVDHKQRLVYNGSDLGKGYTATGMMARMAMGEWAKPQMRQQLPEENSGVRSVLGNPLQALLQETDGTIGLPSIKKRKRKKKRGRNP
ncbi:Relaxase/Mobilization nuclease domain protein [compost metagenome]